VKEVPEIVRLYQGFAARGVRFIGVSVAYDRPDHVIAFRVNHHIPYELSLDIDGALEHYYDIDFIPATLLISKQGKVVYRQNGMIDPAVMTKLLNTEIQRNGE
jgi:peroxiredoxin